MKHVFILLVISMFVTTANATRIVATVNNGKWSLASTWSLNRVPGNSDTIEIPKNLTVKVDGNELLNRVVVDISGLLQFTNGKLRLDIASKVLVQVGGKITGGGSNDQLRINNILKYDGNDDDIIGFAFADATTGSGFFGSFEILAVQFVSFTASKTNSGVLLKWITTNESDNKVFEIQKSNDGRSWSAIGQVLPQSSVALSYVYEFFDKSVLTQATHYRIKQIDNNGAATFTPIRTVTGKSNGSEIKTYKSGSSIVLEFEKVPAQPISVRVLNMNGSAVAIHFLKNPSLRNTIPINGLAGAYVVQVVSIENTQSKKIIF